MPLYEWIEASFTRLGSCLKLLCLHQIFRKFPKELLLSLQILPFCPVLPFLLLSSSAEWTQTTRPSSPRSQSLTLSTPKCSPWGGGVNTLAASHTPPRVKGLTNWLCLHEVNSCKNLISVQVLVYVYVWKEFYAESFFKEIVLSWICAFL